MSDRSLIATFPDGSQILYQEWTVPSGVTGEVHSSVARRDDRWATWGPPINMEEAP